MKVIEVEKKDGFICNEKKVVIYKKGVLFYEFEKNKPHYFNLPKGIYTTSNKLFRVKPKQYKIVLPKPEKKGYTPNGCTIVITEKGGFGATEIDEKKIFLNKILFNKYAYIPCLYFVYAHELGHNFYFDESKCDLFASNLLLAWGFNKSQIIKAKNLTLKDKKRVCENFELINKL